MKILVLFLFLIALVNKLQMQELPDCMCVPLKHPPSGYLVNKDSAVVLDTCRIWYPFESCDSSYWGNVFSEYGIEAMNRIYAKSTWTVWFDVKAFLIPEGPADTLIEVTWRDIDSLNYPILKDSLELIEQNYGSFTLRKIHPQFTETILSQEFIMYFEEYVNVLKILDQFRSIPNTYCDFISWLADDYPISVKVNSNTSINISPNLASEYIEINVGARHAVPVRKDQIQIFNVYGVKMTLEVQNFEPLLIDVSGFPDGMYFLKLSESSKLSESYRIYKFVVIK